MLILKNFKKIDFSLFFLALLISILGLTILYPVLGAESSIFNKQIISLVIASGVFLITSQLDIYFLKNNRFIIFLYLFSIGLLILLFFIGSTYGGARSWFDLGSFSFQPTDLMKLVLILILAKFFLKRHIRIRSLKYIFISGIYTLIPFLLILFQPDFGSAMVIIIIWFGMILISGLPKRMIFIFLLLLSIIALLFYNFIFADYQKERILTFFNPEADALGAGYSVIQSKIAIGSGEFLGKGVGEGTQSRLLFLPEYETDFIFAAYAEEWGFLGVLFLFFLYFLLFGKIALIAIKGRTNFEFLLASGILIYFMSHFTINIGINLGLMPVTGITLPFMSSGGSHLVISFFALGILNSIAKSNKSFHRKDLKSYNII